MGRWDYDAANEKGYPEDYLTWYWGTYKPLVGDDPVGLEHGIHIWRVQREQEIRRQAEQQAAGRENGGGGGERAGAAVR